MAKTRTAPPEFTSKYFPDSAEIIDALTRKRPPLLLSRQYDEDTVRALVLQRFPVGTTRRTVLKGFPAYFSAYDWRFSAHNGVWINQHGVTLREGTNVLTITVYKNWPLGMAQPFVDSRFVLLNFDGDTDLVNGDGRLLDVRVRSEVDAL